MRILIVDNSNTRTKFALADGHQLDPWRAIIPTPEISPKSLEECLADINWDASIISSVVPQKAAILASWLGNKPCHQLSHLSKLPIGINYPKPEQIGADRLANAVGAHALFGSPCIVLDFGTAVTFDVIASADDRNEVQAPAGDGASAQRAGGVQAHADDCKEVQASAGDGASAQRAGGAHASNHPSYQGGVIAPGLASMTEGLANRTALLPHITLQEPECAIGKSTEQAMLAGAVYGYRGLVREILHNLNKEFPNDPLVIATGGDAPLITRGLDEITHLSPDLTLEGLKIIAHLNISYP
jgi:type III pantothenate kinase